jgi:hypothetical protein
MYGSFGAEDYQVLDALASHRLKNSGQFENLGIETGSVLDSHVANDLRFVASHRGSAMDTHEVADDLRFVVSNRGSVVDVHDAGDIRFVPSHGGSALDTHVADDLRFIVYDGGNRGDHSRFKHDLLRLETDSCCGITKLP